MRACKFLIKVLPLGVLLAAPAAFSEGVNTSTSRQFCLDLSPQNLVPFKNARSRAQGFQAVPHVSVRIYRAVNQQTISQSYGFYPRADKPRYLPEGRSLRQGDRMSDAEKENGGGRKCVQMTEAQAIQCQQWINRQIQNSESGQSRPSPRLSGTSYSQPRPDRSPTAAKDYGLLSNNCATFAADAALACTGQRIDPGNALGIPTPTNAYSRFRGEER